MELIGGGLEGVPGVAFNSNGDGALPLLDMAGDIRPLEELEGEIIRKALKHYEGQMSEVARRLKIGRSTLYRKIKELEIEVPS